MFPAIPTYSPSCWLAVGPKPISRNWPGKTFCASSQRPNKCAIRWQPRDSNRSTNGSRSSICPANRSRAALVNTKQILQKKNRNNNKLFFDATWNYTCNSSNESAVIEKYSTSHRWRWRNSAVESCRVTYWTREKTRNVYSEKCLNK